MRAIACTSCQGLDEEATKKMDENELAAKRKCPVSKQVHKNCKSVLSPAKIVANYKYLRASEIEFDTAVALINKNRNVKVILHYDATSHNSVDTEWPSLTLNFSDKKTFSLRPLFFLCK